jgi:hypothetical protein
VNIRHRPISNAMSVDVEDYFHVASVHNSLSHDLRHLGEGVAARWHARIALRESPTAWVAYLELFKSMLPARLLQLGRKRSQRVLDPGKSPT